MPGKKILSLLGILSFFIFVYFSYLVSKELFVQFDFDTTVKVQDRISRNWDLPFSMLSLLGSAEITGLVWVVLSLYLLIRKYFLAFLSMSLLVVATAIEIFGKLFLLHPAPPFLFFRGVLDFSFPSHYVQADYSYPSGHVTRTTFLITFVILLIYFKSAKTTKFLLIPPLLLLFLAMVVSRVYLGEHWTTDVIGGALLGGSFGILSAVTIPLRQKNAQHT